MHTYVQRGSCESHMCFSVLEMLTKNFAKGIGITPVQGRCAKIYKSMFRINNSKEEARTMIKHLKKKKKDGLMMPKLSK